MTVQQLLTSSNFDPEACAPSAQHDLFIDLSSADLDRERLKEYLYHLAQDVHVRELIGHTTLALPADINWPIDDSALWLYAQHSTAPTLALERAIIQATSWRRHLIVLLGALVPKHDAVSRLVQVFREDPMLGTAQPRFSEGATDRIWLLPRSMDRQWPGSMTARNVLSFLPAYTITHELLACCIVVRWEALVACEAVDHGFRSVAGALLRILCELRRRGFGNAVVNHALVSSDLPYRSLYPAPVDEDLTRLRVTYPDSVLAESRLAALSQQQMEPLLAAAHPGRGPRRILLDCRGMPPRHNGSAQCVLGFLNGFSALDCSQQIDILVAPDVARFHSLSFRYPAFRQISDQLDDAYSAAISFTQPWDLRTVAELHRHALVIVFGMLDTIAWDILYPDGASGLATVWRFVAGNADGLIYNSNFTRERFGTRFAVKPGVRELVAHHSFLAEEYVDPVAQTTPADESILVFGNQYEHKNLESTVQLLVDAFPFNRIVAFGTSKGGAPNVVAIPSGDLDQTELHRLIASARVIVYPSFYEGFGLPVVEGLAYGRPVIVRRSALWAEIAGSSRLPGDLIEFDDTPSLVEAVGRVLAGMPNPVLPRGVHLNDDAGPLSWKDCAARVLTLLSDCLGAADGSRWLEREEVLRLAGL